MYKIKRFSSIKPLINMLSPVKRAAMSNIGIDRTLLNMRSAEIKARDMIKEGLIGKKTALKGPNTSITSKKTGVDRVWKKDNSSFRKELRDGVITDKRDLAKSIYGDISPQSSKNLSYLKANASINRKIPGDIDYNKSIMANPNQGMKYGGVINIEKM